MPSRGGGYFRSSVGEGLERKKGPAREEKGNASDWPAGAGSHEKKLTLTIERTWKGGKGATWGALLSVPGEEGVCEPRQLAKVFHISVHIKRERGDILQRLLDYKGKKKGSPAEVFAHRLSEGEGGQMAQSDE